MTWYFENTWYENTWYNSVKINDFTNYIFPPNTLLGRMEKKVQALNSDLRPAIFLAIYLDSLSISFLYIVCRFIVKTEVIYSWILADVVMWPCSSHRQVSVTCKTSSLFYPFPFPLLWWDTRTIVVRATLPDGGTRGCGMTGIKMPRSLTLWSCCIGSGHLILWIVIHERNKISILLV